MGFGKFDKEEPVQDTRSHLMCVAHGCPNRWSVDAGNGRLCSRHAWKPAVEWPAITEDIQLRPQQPAEQEIRKVSQQEKLDILRKLQKVGRPDDPKLWARALQEREKRGDKMTPTQKSAWREALRVTE